MQFAHIARNLKGQDLDEAGSMRLLVHAVKLIVAGIEPIAACRSAIDPALTDAAELLAAVEELGASPF